MLLLRKALLNTHSILSSSPPSKHTQVFLQHLPSLSQLQNFPEIWLRTFDFMDKFLHLDNFDLLVSLQWYLGR